MSKIIIERPAQLRFNDRFRPALNSALDVLRIRRFVRAVRARLFGPKSRIRERWRMPVRNDSLKQAIEDDELSKFDSWLQVDGPHYRTGLPNSSVLTVEKAIMKFDYLRNNRLEGVKQLLSLPSAPPSLREFADQPLLRVPLLIMDRDEVAAKLRMHGLRTPYIYDPPLDIYAGPSFTKSPFATENSEWWSAHVLPIDPLMSDQFLAVTETHSISLNPAID
ncbi:MAG: hypothetical protein IH859_10050 [Chloroflexi bacterium]|nr:hypothetical protein [Chloroflexota bacterium]